ncbi:unnamed protein product [Dovyalis caffra]|uniref:Uncharacterized protein n=1 Tax=Dovyalis caffra TaxID=77055 RepID=A0AAV1R1X6_9ROSI|nr:unnamed protein product [Dovyalis caffra]
MDPSSSFTALYTAVSVLSPLLSLPLVPSISVKRNHQRVLVRIPRVFSWCTSGKDANNNAKSNTAGMEYSKTDSPLEISSQRF